MEIISKPTSYSFAGNVRDIIIRAQSAVAFKLSLNDASLLDERYDPINGVVTIKLRELLERITPKASIEAGSVPLSLYKYSVDSEVGEFYCVCGGHGASSDAVSFMRSNWLTWQPQSRTTTFHTPQRLVYAAISDINVKLKAYFSDNTSQEITLASLGRGFLHTIDVTFGAIYSRFEKHPISFDVWVEGNQTKSYVQRYYLSNESADADIFMWYNSVGGVDTVEFNGERGEDNKINSLAAVFGQDEVEFDNDRRKIFTKYTGYIEKENTRLWVLDFFNSTLRFHIDQGAVRRIVVSDPKLKHTRGTLAGFEFDFAYSVQSPYLNLPRRDVPEILEIVAPDDSLFFLAPRLLEFPRAEIDQGEVLIPCQFANGKRWLVIALADIISQTGGGGSGGLGNLRAVAPLGLTVKDGTYTLTHHLAPEGVDADKTADKFGHVSVSPHPYGGRRDIPLTASSLTSDNVSSHEALASMIGYGFILKINPETGKSELWVDGVHARDFFETLEMRFRKMLVSGEELVVNNGGVVKEVLPPRKTLIRTSTGKVITTHDGRPLLEKEHLAFVVKGEAGIDYQQFVEDDILRYTWRDTTTGYKGASGYLLVRSAVDEFTYTADILEGSPEWLKEGMTLALFGNLTNKERQGFIVLSARERTIAIYDGVNSVRITPDNLKVLLGNLSGIVDPAFPEMKGSGLFSSNCYLRGQFALRSGKLVEKEFERVETEFQIVDGKIASKVSQITYDRDQETITKSVESLAQQTAEGFSQTVTKQYYDETGVKKNQIISSINQSAEEIKLEAEKISFEGAVTANDNFRVLPDGSIEAKDSKFSGTVTATGGQIAGFLIEEKRIVGEKGSDGGQFVLDSNGDNGQIGFSNASIGQHVWFGANTVSATYGKHVLFNLQNHEASYGDVNHGIIISVRNGAYNLALKTEGNIVSDGLNTSYNMVSVVPPPNKALELGYDCATQLIYSVNQNSGVTLPRRDAVARELGIGVNVPFSVRITIIIQSGSRYGGSLFGRNNDIPGQNTNYYPIKSDNNGNEFTGIDAYAIGDIFEFQLVFDGSNYRAYYLNNKK